MTVHVIGEFEMHKDEEHINEFWKLLGGRVEIIKSAVEGGSDDKPIAVKNMLKLSDESGTLEMTNVPFSRASFNTHDVFIIDVGSEVFVWVGKGTSEKERKYALQYGQNYITKSGKPAWTQLSRVMEGGENEALFSHF